MDIYIIEAVSHEIYDQIQSIFCFYNQLDVSGREKDEGNDTSIVLSVLCCNYSTEKKKKNTISNRKALTLEQKLALI